MRNIQYLCCLLLWLCTYATQAFAQENNTNTATERVFDTNFKERYAGRKYNYEGREIVGSTQGGDGNYSEYKKQKDPTIEEENNTDEASSLNNFNFLSWIFIAALFIAVIYLAYILLNDGTQGLFSSKGSKKIIDHQDITAENIEKADIVSLINAAEGEKNYRLAIRYHYILVLKKLSLKNFIKFEEDKTNQDYYQEIENRTFSDNFAYTSYLYNYIWYGEFSIDATQYHKAKSSFDHLIHRIQ